MEFKDLKFNGVLIEETPDPRNYPISRFVPKQEEITDEAFCLPLPEREIILNQKHYNSCVGHAFAMCKSILEYKHTKKWIDFDPYMIYGTRYKGEYEGEGMYPKQGAKVLQKEGAFFRRDFNIEGEVPSIQITVEEFKKDNPCYVKQAENFKIDGYAFVYNVNQIKTALKNGMPIAVAYPVYESFYKTGEDGILPMNKPGEKIVGYHEMVIVGWTHRNHWIVLNSWGTDYGMKGVYYIPFIYDFDSAIAVTDTITPSIGKAFKIELFIGGKYAFVNTLVRDLDVAPLLQNNRTYVPVRFVAENLGVSVEWNSEEQKVTIRSEEAVIEMTIGKRFYYVNGKRHISDVPPIIVNNRTMLPIRKVAEALNCKIEWSQEPQKVTITAL